MHNVDALRNSVGVLLFFTSAILLQIEVEREEGGREGG
jgi:hypothetical protein